MPDSALSSARRFLSGIAPRRQRISIQAGDATARILLTRREVSGLRIEKLVTIDLAADGLLTPEEMARRVGQILDGMPASAPVAVALPLGRSHSQIMELTPGDTRAPWQLTQAVGGRQFDQVPSIFDSRRLRAFDNHAHPAWVTIAREADVELQLLRCGLDAESVTHVSSADGALAAAFAEVSERPSSAVLVELGTVSGMLVLIVDDQVVFSAGIDTGATAFVAALAADLHCPAEEAEIVIRREGPAAVSDSTPKLRAALARWSNTIETLLREHARETGASPEALLVLPRWFSGSLLEDYKARAMVEAHAGGDASQRWPEVAVGDGHSVSLAACAIAWGVAAISSGLQPAPANLLPAVAREARRLRRRTGWLHAACLALLLPGLMVVGHACVTRLDSIHRKEQRLALLEEARAAGPRLADALAARESAYLEAAPSLYLQKRTRDLLGGLRTLRSLRTEGSEAARDKADFWYAVIADVETYSGGALPKGSPAAMPETQLLRGCFSRSSGLVVELSLAPANKDPLGTIGALVNALRTTGHFTSVDILPVRARQALADPAVFAPGGDFALALETTPFEHTLPPPPPAPPGGNGGSRSRGGLFGP
ncbi:hypothetical protein OpiT1DRAFT_00308 [Opitutaceae bacterium TAV1]|nr:hypothetical protein OpiT1DRAFT_00308 [Opitutaceae bacterium TAV1]